jgi:hypothetical protein
MEQGCAMDSKSGKSGRWRGVKDAMIPAEQKEELRTVGITSWQMIF